MVEPVTILHSIPAYSYTGPETLVKNVFERIDRDRFRIDFIVQTPTANPDFEYYERNGSMVHIIKSRPKENLPNYIREVAAKFAAISHHYDILHSHVPLYGTLFAYLAMRHGIGTRIAHSHATQVDGLEQHVKLRAILPFHNRIHNHFAACSRQAAEYFFGKRRDVYIMRNAFDLSRFKFSADDRKSAREEFALSDKWVIGHTGRFAPQKNHSLLLTIFKAIADRVPEATLLLLGDGPLFDHISELVEKLGVKGRVCFAGRRQDVPRMLSAMDLFVFPSHWEAVPFAPLEAQANGLPCLMSSTITHEVKRSLASKLLDLTNPVSAWANAALELRQLRSMTTKIDASLDEFDISRAVPDLERYYLSLASKEKREVKI